MTRARELAELSTAYDSGGLPMFKNRIINGAMMIDQRNAGASVTNSTGNIYTLDRWLNTTVGSSCSVQQVAGTGNNKAIRVTGASGNSTTQLTQRIEANNIYDCASQTVTVSFTLYGSGSGSVSVRFLYPTATDNFTTQTEPVAGTTVNFTTTPTTYTVTRTLDANANKGLGLVFERGATGAGVTWTLENVQLEKGSTATSFDYRPYGTELALCQRHYQLIQFGCGAPNGSTSCVITIQPFCPMRSAPTVGQTGVLYISNYITDHVQSSTNIVTYTSYVNMLTIGLGNFTGLTQLQPFFLRGNNTNAITLSAEL